MTTYQLQQRIASKIDGSETWFLLAEPFDSAIYADKMIADAAKRGLTWRRVAKPA